MPVPLVQLPGMNCSPRLWDGVVRELLGVHRPDGHATLESLVQHTATYGYRLETTGATDPADRFLRARLVRDGDAST